MQSEKYIHKTCCPKRQRKMGNKKTFRAIWTVFLELVMGCIRFAAALLNDQKALPFGSRFAPCR